MKENIGVEKFRELFETRDAVTTEWKQNSGKKIAGCISTYIPEEILYAADVLPVIAVGNTENLLKADMYLPSFACSYMRGFLEKLLEEKYIYLDIITLPSLCDSIWGFYGIWTQISENLPIYLLHYPSAHSKEALEYFIEEVARFKNFVEAFTGKIVFERDLETAIDVYNKSRRLLRRLYELKKKESPPISGVETLEIVLSSMTMPKDKHNQLLEELLNGLAERKAYPEGKERLLVSGHIIEDPSLLKIIEETGGLIVSDDLDSGTRYFSSLVNESRNPIEAISERYFNLPSPYRSRFEDRIKHHIALVKEFQVDGVVFLTRKFCDPYLFDYPILNEAMKEEGVPTLHIEYEYPIAKMSLKTRVEAFIEMLR